MCIRDRYYDANGAVAFGMDSVLSHISIMHGGFPESPYSLKPGQLLPAQYTDEGVKGGVYFYGSLFACPPVGAMRSGQMARCALYDAYWSAIYAAMQ